MKLIFIILFSSIIINSIIGYEIVLNLSHNNQTCSCNQDKPSETPSDEGIDPQG